MNGPGGSLPFLFGPYELLVRLGHGGMGQVYLARRATLAGSDSLCVLKTLKPELVDDAEYVGRFLDEVRTVMQLRHSSISHVFDAGQHAGTYYMAMEHLSGVTARELWQAAKGGALDLGLALLVIEDVLGALAYAHAFKSPLTGAPLSVVHRDVSPHNVIVTFEGEVKLIDFGLAESVLKQEHTESQVVMGKISYMSPEQARGEDVDGACDQFAAAVMLYELATGERFYGARNNSEIWGVVGFGGFRPDGFSALPPPLAAILERALAADRKERFPDCRAFQAALEGLHAEHSPNATRSRLRAFMQAAFAEQQRKQQQELLRSAALASEVQQHTQSVSASRPSASLSADVWASSSTPPRATAPVARDVATVQEPSESLRVPRSRAPAALALVGVVAALALGGYLATGGGDEDIREATTSEALAQERPPPERPTLLDPPAPDPEKVRATDEVPEGESANESTQAADESAAATHAAKARPARKRSRPDRSEAAALTTTSVEDEGAPAPPDEPAATATTPEPSSAAASMTNAEALAIVKGCALGCAPRVLALPGVKDGSVLTQKPNAVVLNCARRCLAR